MGIEDAEISQRLKLQSLWQCGELWRIASSNIPICGACG